MVKDFVAYKYTAVGGAAGAGKSYVLAAWGIISWLSSPSDTIVLVTSTTLQAARTRVWGCVIALLDAVEGLPIKIRDSIGSAAFLTHEGTILETSGIRLIAAERGQTRDAVGKIIGIHQTNVLLLADELTELSPSIITAGISNLERNVHFELRAAANPASRFDAFGDWSTPVDGWDSVDVLNDDCWPTKYGGFFRRLDALKSPNFNYDYLRYPYLPSADDIDKATAIMGPTSRPFLRMFRAAFASTDTLDTIYSEPELNRSRALSPVSLSRTVKLASLDPSFSSGGDESILTIGELGYDPEGNFVLQPTEYLRVDEDETTGVPRTYQIARQVKELCEARGIEPHNFGLDATGAGSPLADVIAGEWSPEILRVQFSGKASDKPVSAHKRTPACQLFTNRVSELWGAGRELVRCGQLRGLSNDVAREMCGRTYDSVKSEHGLRIRVEPKASYKNRLGYSPDRADSFFVLVELARDRFGLLAMEPIKDDDGMAVFRRHRTVRSLDAVTATRHAHLVD